MRSIVLLSVVPVMAVVAWARPAESPHIEYPALPSLRFNQHAIVHGEVEPKPIVSATFRFTNESDKPTEIVELVPSCGCLKPQLEGGRKDGEVRRFAPGESGEFTIGVETANEPAGQQLYSVLVRSKTGEDTSSQVVRYAVTLPVKKLTVTPNALFFLQVQGEAGEQKIELFDPREKRAKVLLASCDHPLVSVTHAVTDRPGVCEVVVAVEEGLPAGDAKTFVRIETDDPEYPVLRVPILLRGPRG